MPHMGSALLVACDLLVACTMALRDYSGRPRLRSAAAGAIAVVLLQVALGITTFVLLLADMDGALVTRFAAGAHICGGALTLAASVRLSLCAAGTGGS
jgi:heme A synthase